MTAFYGEPVNPYYSGSSGNFQTLLRKAIRGFGATTISGAGGTGKTTLATAVTSLAAQHVDDGTLLSPYQFSEKGYDSTELDLFLMDFLALFFTPSISAIALKAVSNEVENKIRKATSDIHSQLTEVVKVQVAAYLGTCANPRQTELQMQYSLWSQVVEADPRKGTSGPYVDENLDAKIQSHVEATGVMPTDDELRRMGATTEQTEALAGAKSVELPAHDAFDSLNAMIGEKVDSAETLLAWLVQYPSVLHAVASSGAIIDSLRFVGRLYADALTSAFGHSVVVRNEKKPRTTDLEVSIDAEDPTFAYFSFVNNDINASAPVRATPLRVARGLAYAYVVHISTLSDAYARDIQSTTLAGGMSTGITDAIQALNDRAADAGARFVIETRDDYTPKGASDDEAALFEDRFMASSRVSFYLKEKGSGRWRTRKYSELDQEEADARDDFSFSFERDISPLLSDGEAVTKKDTWDILQSLQETDNG